jgi:hypothetical protein
VGERVAVPVGKSVGVAVGGGGVSFVSPMQ